MIRNDPSHSLHLPLFDFSACALFFGWACVSISVTEKKHGEVCVYTCNSMRIFSVFGF